MIPKLQDKLKTDKQYLRWEEYCKWCGKVSVFSKSSKVKSSKCLKCYAKFKREANAQKNKKIPLNEIKKEDLI